MDTTKTRGFRALCLAVYASGLFSCGEECAFETSTYLATFEQTSGDCGAREPELVMPSDGAETFGAASCQRQVEFADECAQVTATRECSERGRVSMRTSYVLRGGDEFYAGTLQAWIQPATGASCRSLYQVTLTRQ